MNNAYNRTQRGRLIMEEGRAAYMRAILDAREQFQSDEALEQWLKDTGRFDRHQEMMGVK